MNNSKGPKLGAEKTVLEVVTISVCSSRHTVGIKDDQSFAHLEAAGFKELGSQKGRTVAGCIGGESRFLFEYDPSHHGNQKPGSVLSFAPNCCREIETGMTLYIPDLPDTAGLLEVLYKGDHLIDWELKCRKPDQPLLDAYREKARRGEVKKYADKTYSSSRKPRSADLAPPSELEEEEEKEQPQRPHTNGRIVTPVALPSVNGIVSEQILIIPIEKIVVFQQSKTAPTFSGQPRKEFVQMSLNDLADSIKEHTQLVPGLVRRIEGSKDEFELIAGERRYRACRLAGIPYYRAIEKKPATKQAQHMLALIENFHREDPNPLDISNALQEQIDAGQTQESLARATSMSISQIQKYLAIQTLRPELKPFLQRSVPDPDRIRLATAEVLAKVHPDHQVRIWQEAKKEPTQGLIVAKIHELGRSLFQFKRGRSADRWLEGAEVSRRVERRFYSLTKALLELKAVTPEQWTGFMKHLGVVGTSGDIGRLNETIQGLTKLKEEIARVRRDVHGMAPKY